MSCMRETLCSAEPTNYMQSFWKNCSHFSMLLSFSEKRNVIKCSKTHLKSQKQVALTVKIWTFCPILSKKMQADLFSTDNNNFETFISHFKGKL